MLYHGTGNLKFDHLLNKIIHKAQAKFDIYQQEIPSIYDYVVECGIWNPNLETTLLCNTFSAVLT